MVAPTDGRELDTLQRWKGAPIISWGVGGTMVTSFPKNVPRYGIGQTAPMIIRSPGEVHVKHIKDIQPLEERLAKFPGPLKGKSKKKETVTWLTAGIESLERELPDISFQTQLSHEHKRAVERVLLWKILRVFVEFDGTLEGAPAVDKAVRDVLAPGLTVEEGEPTPGYGAVVSAEALQESSVTQMKADAVDASTMDHIRKHLLVGEREKAVWAAVDKRLWGHAMLISNTVSPDLYKQVAQEFVRKEVNYPGHNNESVAALYKVLSGNFDDCVDELVPVHARAGFQLMNTTSAAGPAKDATEGLDKWRETLGLVLSNRSTDDVRALNALGNLLSSYGRAEAAHICFLFGRKATIFGGLDDGTSNFVLVGADHKTQGDQFAKETEALLLSEVYEFGLSLSGTSPLSAGVPHLAAYKLQHAMTLAEYGLRDKALQYCEAIAGSITAQTKRSPYYHPILETAVENLRARLKQAPKEESSSWISKPSMNKVSDSVWSRFNKFVAGDENENAAAGGSAEGAESGPFARITGGTPTISRSPSVSNFEPLPYEPRTSMDSQPGNANGGYMPQSLSGPSLGYTPPTSAPAQPGAAPVSPLQPPANSPYEPYGVSQPSTIPSVEVETQTGTQESNDLSGSGYQPPSYGYEPPSLVPNDEPQSQGQDSTGSDGYQPPSFQPYGYEPPSYNPEPEADEESEEPKRKPKSFMDDDDDDIPGLKALRSTSEEKSKAEKDKENEEMFKKAAEEDAKRAAAAQQQKKGWGFSSWFGGKKEAIPDAAQPNKPIKAKLGEANNFVYDPELKRWVNKAAGADQAQAKTATPPPPKAGPRSMTGTPPPRILTPPMGRASAPPGGPPVPDLAKTPSIESLGGGPPGPRPPAMMRSVSNTSAAGGPLSGPPSRPATSMSNASSIDDLLSAAGPRKPGAKKAKKGGRYVDVMAKEVSQSSGQMSSFGLTEDELALEKKLRWKIDLMIMPLIVWTYLMNYIDRNNYAAARLQGLEADLNLTDTQYQIGLSVLFITYVLAQVPSNMMLNHIGKPAYYLGFFTIAWGLVSALTALVQNFAGIIACRLVLGLVGVSITRSSPHATYSHRHKVIFYLSKWYTKKELSLRMALFYNGSLIAGAFGNLIAAGILKGLDKAHGISAWRWLYILEGVVTVATGILICLVLPDFPESWRALSPELRRMATKRLAVDAAESDVDETRGPRAQLEGFKMALRDPKVWILTVAYHAFVGAGGFQNFFPSLTRTLGFDDTVSLLLVAPPYIFMAFYCAFHSWLSDRVQNRFWFFMYPISIVIAGCVIFMTTTAFGPRYFSLFLLNFVFTMNGTTYAWMSTCVPRPPAKRAAALGFMNAVGNAASIWTSYTYFDAQGDRYPVALGIVIALLGVSAVGGVWQRWILVRENKRLDRLENEDVVVGDKEMQRLGETAHVEGVDVGTARQRQKGFRYLI
ncbi:COPII coat assembly protein sec16 [Colletotrichum sp. SAR11_59]|nr:COPII coat assembly protein sec16 [Colletotrichum sp. SAR11_59]